MFSLNFYETAIQTDQSSETKHLLLQRARETKSKIQLAERLELGYIRNSRPRLHEACRRRRRS